MADAYRRRVNYTGIAALVTALAGAAAVFWKQDTHEQRQEIVQGTTFTVLQYRLQRVERDLDTLRRRLRVVELEQARRGGRPSPSPVAVAVPDESEIGGEGVSEGALVRKVKGRQAVDLDDVQQYVDKANRPLKMEDF